MNDKVYTLHIDPPKKRRPGQHKEGYHAWNKGLSWDKQGWTKERREKVIANLRKNKAKNKHKNMKRNSKPVIQTDEDGNRLHWYESSVSAAKKLGVNYRNIREVCYGRRKHCGGFRWKFDERFLT